MKRWMICLAALVFLAGIACPALAEYEEDPARVAVNLQAIKVMLDANDLIMDYDEANDCFEVWFELENDRLDSCVIWLIAYDDGVEIEAEYEACAPEECWRDAAVLLNRLNVDLRLGNLYLDEDTGGLGYHTFLFGDVLPPTQNGLEYSLGYALWLLETCGDAMAALFYDGVTAEDAYQLLQAY